jgi:hypothetical protein
MKARRGFADRSRRVEGHTGGHDGLTADEIYARVMKGQTGRLTAAQQEYAERQGWLRRLLGGR